MITVLSCVAVQHDISLVVLAAILCTFGSWVTSRLYRHSLDRSFRQAISWHLLTALTAGVSIWCTHFVAMLGFRPDVPVNFDLGLTFVSLLIAVLGSAMGIFISSALKMRFAPVIGGAVFGLAIAAMHYAGMIAYRVQGIVYWREDFLIASIILSVLFSSVALYLGSKPRKQGEYQMAILLTVAIVSLHFTGMTAFRVAPLSISGDFVNPEAFKVLAIAITGTALIIVMGALFSYAVENRTRMESIAELTAARNAAESASRAKSEFMSVLSHELRTPLTIILGYSGILSQLKVINEQKKPPAEGTVDLATVQLGEQVDLYGKKISVAANHLLTLINEILDYTSMELGDAKLIRTSFPVQELLAEAEDQFQELANQKSITLHVESDGIVAHADRGRCLQILINLIGNALKFSKSSDVFIRGKIEENGFSIEVEDNGCGIKEENLGVIFHAFQQIEDADNRSEGGTGLGLAICRKLAIAHGGDISVESVVGSGTTFKVTMPASAVEGVGPEAVKRLEMSNLRMAG